MIREWVLERLELEQGNSPVKLDITLNKEKVGSIALASTVLNIIDKKPKILVWKFLHLNTPVTTIISLAEKIY